MSEAVASDELHAYSFAWSRPIVRNRRATPFGAPRSMKMGNMRLGPANRLSGAGGFRASLQIVWRPRPWRALHDQGDAH
jgi:hypothetical protein